MAKRFGSGLAAAVTNGDKRPLLGASVDRQRPRYYLAFLALDSHALRLARVRVRFPAGAIYRSESSTCDTFASRLGQIWAKLAAKSRKIGSNRAKNSSVSSRSLVGVCTQVPYVS